MPASQLSAENDELVVSDDGSLDDTVNVLNSYNDQRVKDFSSIGHGGVTRDFENALYKAKGGYIFLADQDDVWLPCKVELCVNALQVHQVVVTNCCVTDRSLKVVNESYFRMWGSSRGVV